MLAKGRHGHEGEEMVTGRRRGGLQYTLADFKRAFQCVLSLLQNEKETEQLKSLERLLY